MSRMYSGILILATVSLSVFAYSAASRMTEATLVALFLGMTGMCASPVIMGAIMMLTMRPMLERSRFTNAGPILDATPQPMQLPPARVNVPRFSSSHNYAIRDVELVTDTPAGSVVVSRADLLAISGLAGVKPPTRAALAECGILGHERAASILSFLSAHDLVRDGAKGRASAWRGDVSPDMFTRWVRGLAD